MRTSDLRAILLILIAILLCFIAFVVVMANQIGYCVVISSGTANIPEPSELSLYAMAAPFLIWKIL